MHKPRKNGECNLEVVVKDGVVSTEIAHGEEMAHIHSVGPGDPLLAKQKHHHRKAFEYISKALKIDEENEGEMHVVILFVAYINWIISERNILFQFGFIFWHFLIKTSIISAKTLNSTTVARNLIIKWFLIHKICTKGCKVLGIIMILFWPRLFW